MSDVGSKPAIAVLHHLSSSGGTVIARTLAAMPDVVMISEVHPSRVGALRFNPYDPVALLQASYPELALPAATLHAHFSRRVAMVAEQCVMRGKHLVLRNHAHSDFLGERPTGRLEIEQALNSAFQMRRVATVRDPVDAWLSMKASGFADHIADFDEYCVRVEAFLAHFRSDEVITYERFVAQRSFATHWMCERLGLPYSSDHEDAFASISLTGNSGRARDWKTVKPVVRRAFSPAFRRAVLKSEAYARIADRFGYPRDPIDHV